MPAAAACRRCRRSERRTPPAVAAPAVRRYSARLPATLGALGALGTRRRREAVRGGRKRAAAVGAARSAVGLGDGAPLKKKT